MIRLTRGNNYVDKIRAYKIFIDDIYCGNIKNNETKDFEVANGSHIIYAKIDWCRSNKFNIIVSDSMLELEIGPYIRGNTLWIPFAEALYVTFKKNEYLWIKEKADTSK